MIARIIAGWLAVAASVIVSLILYGTSRWIQNAIDQLLSGRALPVISTWFYPPSLWPYWFPVVGAAVALYCTFRARHSDSAWLLCVTISLSLCVVFTAVCIFSLSLPWLPMRIGILTPK